MSRFLLSVAAAAFCLTVALPIGSVITVLDSSARAADMQVKKVRKSAPKHTSKYQYQYIPNASGRTGGWR